MDIYLKFFSPFQGIIRGYNVTMERRQVFNPLFPKDEYHIEKSISIFLGIPYAKAPDRKVSEDDWYQNNNLMISNQMSFVFYCFYLDMDSF